MLRVSVMYPNQPGKKFDWDYYLNKHRATVHRELDPYGLLKTEVDRGVGSAQPGTPAPCVAVFQMYFNGLEEMQSCMAHSAEVMADVANYTDIQPQVQVSEVI